MPTTVTDTMPNINPHMKFKKTQVGVVRSPEVYQYSLRSDIERADRDYKTMMRSVEKRKMARLSEKYPNLTHNILGIMKTMCILFAAYCGMRYRHSIPLIKSICSKPKGTPPSFISDIKKLFGGK